MRQTPSWSKQLQVLIFMILPLSCAGNLWSAGRRLSFSEALQIAKDQQVDLLVANERVQQALARLTQARSALFPQVTGTASMVRQTKNLEAFGINIPGANPLVGPFNTFDARLGLTQAIFDAQALERLRAVRIGRLVSEAELQKTRQDVLALAATLYLEAQRSHEQIAMSQSLLRATEERLKIARTRKDVGEGSSVDVLTAESDAASARNRLAASKAQAIERRLDLQAALGLPEDEQIIFARDGAMHRFKLPTEAEVVAAAEGHPAVEAARQTVREREAERSVEKADFLPRVSASADYGASGSSPTHSDGTYSFGGQMTVPIFKGGLRLGRIREASSRVRESEARLSGARRETEAKARAAIESVLQAQSFLQAASADDAEASKRLMLAKERLASGIGSALELTEAESRAIVAKDGRLEADATYRLAQVRLAQAMGRMESLGEL